MSAKTQNIDFLELNNKVFDLVSDLLDELQKEFPDYHLLTRTRLTGFEVIIKKIDIK